MTLAMRAESALDAVGTADGWHVQARRVDSYSIRLGTGLLDRLGDLLAPVIEHLAAPQLVMVADSGVAATHLPVALAAIEALGLPFTVIEIPAGELSKSVETLHEVWRHLDAAGATRRTLVVGLGGGVVCDLVTATVATYMRGLPYALVPTTVLAQLDAAIGGKGGLDWDGTKNLLGAFHHPALVVLDPQLTSTLPRRQVRNGLAEAIKVALIADPDLAADLECGPPVWQDVACLSRVVRAAVAAKLALLSPDPFELGNLRRTLNLGHCIGHPLEAATDFTMPHGEAVATGIAMAAAVAHRSGYASVSERDRILRLLVAHQLPVTIPADLHEKVWDGLDAVRRIRNGVLHLVLPIRPGHCLIPDRDLLTRAEFDRAVGDLDAWGARP